MSAPTAPLGVRVAWRDPEQGAPDLPPVLVEVDDDGVPHWQVVITTEQMRALETGAASLHCDALPTQAVLIVTTKESP